MESTKANGGEQPPNESLLAPGTSTGQAKNIQTVVKRKAEENPMEHGQSKRSALENITNRQNPGQEAEEKQAQKPNDDVVELENLVAVSLDSQSEDALCMATSSNASASHSGNIEQRPDEQPEPEPEATPGEMRRLPVFRPFRALHQNEEDFDSIEDPLQTWPYAMDIFEYLKERENAFAIDDYMPRQVNLTAWTRTLLIDWMVTVQQKFGMFNETLYLSVKIVDLYLCREGIEEEKMQLLGATAFYIACKYEETDTLQIEELLDVCEEDYYCEELLEMELKTLRSIDYALGIPISYRFLRRYANCVNVPAPTWVLGRYILELSLMDYGSIANSDSQMASAALFIALRMHSRAEELDGETWNPALVYFSGYELSEFAKMVPVLNGGLHRTDWLTVWAIRTKYSQVAMVPLLTNQELFQDNPELYDGNVGEVLA